ncbi:SRPBCC family protein [Roseomonas sp. HJA6]|uniref:SRPBCC family protein n=1 Tax=Roseomonas alba TaxID=2846776 RepID=A0ABS7A327_9PROT|nr:SRPBCC family protein [Neoroseomonas alba]MBW6396674.1 SRPBCC family protein [Neoroseomonas alba]
MNDLTPPNGYGALTEPMTLQIQRMLPGPIERVWAYITDSDLRRQWLAAGPMDQKVGATVEFVWRNDELNTPPSRRPEGFDEEHRLLCEVLEIDPPRRLVITWGRSDGVTFELAPVGQKVLLTITHRRLPDRDMLLKVSAGWHGHLDVLAARMAGVEPAPFWDEWLRLKGEYAKRIPE